MMLPTPLAGERGAIVVQVALAMVVVMGFSAFVFDQGILLVSRQQAQNAADAGAAAGALARAYDDFDNPPSTGGIVGQSATQLVAWNPVWFDGGVASPVISFDCPPDASSSRCVRVDVHRDGSFGSTPLPMLFGPVLGITSQGVRATATAQVAPGNATTCLKPWAVPDKWIEQSVPPDETFVRYVEPGTGGEVPQPDAYDPPPIGGLRAGAPSDIGLELTLQAADPTASQPISTGFLLPIVLGGAYTFEQNISGCNGGLATVGQQFSTGAFGDVAATVDGFAELLAADPDADWDPFTQAIEGSCAPGCAPLSPRLVALAVFDVNAYQLARATADWTACTGGAPCVNIVNIVGFFIDDIVVGDAVGYVTRYPGLVSPDAPSVTEVSSFLPTVTLVR